MRFPRQDPALLVPILSGILGAAAFAPAGFAPAALLAPIPLLLALERSRAGWRRPFVLGWLAAFVQFALILHWVVALPSEEVTLPGIMIPAVLLMASYLALFFGAAACVASLVGRRLGAPVAAVWPLFALLADVGRSIGELAFPWGSPGYALHGWLPVLQVLPWTGFWGLTLWVYAAGALFSILLRRGEGRRRLAILAILLFVGPWVYGWAVLDRASGRQDAGPTLQIRLVQPNTPREIKWKPDFREILIRDLIDRTRNAARGSPDLVVWPETAAPMVLLQEPVYLAWVQEAVAQLRVPLLAGTLDHRFEEGQYVSHNSAALFDSTGRVAARYDKRRLVPFSERMPYPQILPWLGDLNFGQSDFTAGSGVVLFDVGPARIGCLICFESIFPDLARSFVRSGASLLVNITNDFWFGRSAGPVQHAQMAIFRAVETRTPLLRCANTGISLVVDPHGRVVQKTGLFVDGQIDASVRPATKATFYVRHGEWLVLGVLAAAAALVVSAFLARPRSTGPGRGALHLSPSGEDR